MSKRTLMLVVALVAALAIATTSTLAYLTSEDGAVNVMVVGNVEIEQNEEQRPEIGSTVLEDFEQFKPFFPGVYDEVTMEEDATQWPVPDDYVAAEGATGNEWQVYSSDIANVQDKFVTVENTGKNDAYVRTIIAVECPEGLDPELLHLNDNADSTNLIGFTDAGFVELNGVQYMVYCYTYQDALAPGESTVPSLKQVLLDKLADNEDVALLGENFEVLALSQGVQVEGFADADTALDEAFYALGADASAEDVDALIADLEQLLEEEYPGPVEVYTEEDFYTALASAQGEMTIVAPERLTVVVPATSIMVKEGVTIQNVDFIWNAANTYVGSDATVPVNGVVTFENCSFTGDGFRQSMLISSTVYANKEPYGSNHVFNDCDFYGALNSSFANNDTGTCEFNNCTFGLSESDFGYVNCMGGFQTFNACSFDYTGGTTMGSNQYVRYNAVNSYSENNYYSASVVLNGCTLTSTGTQKFGSNSTLTIK